MDKLKVFVDTNVLLDAMLMRQPFYRHSASILHFGQAGRLKLYTTAFSYLNCIYTARKTLGLAETVDSVNWLRGFVHIAPMGQREFDAAMNLGVNDVEDAAQYTSAQAQRCDIIVTRNKKDFAFSQIPILTPQEFMLNPY